MKHSRCGGEHETVQEARDCEDKLNSPETQFKGKPATDAQTRYIRSLLENRDVPDKYASEVNEYLEGKKFTIRGASNTIEALKKLPLRPAISKDFAPKQKLERRAADDGMYVMPGGKIFRVVTALHGSKKPYASLVQIDSAADRDSNGKIINPAKLIYIYSPGTVNILKPEWRMTKEQAQEFGALYGVCSKCDTPLTRPESIARGMGLTCYTNQFGKGAR